MVTNLSDDTKINRKNKNVEENADLRNYVNTVAMGMLDRIERWVNAHY